MIFAIAINSLNGVINYETTRRKFAQKSFQTRRKKFFLELKTNKKMVSTATKQVYLTIEQFDMDLEDCLTIITEPTQRNPYYVCEYVSYALYKSVVHIYITK